MIVRLRPPMDSGKPLAYFADEDDKTKLLGTSQEGGLSPTKVAPSFEVEEQTFARVVAPEESNEEMFDGLNMQELIRGVSCGYQETVFAYGQTGSGKTHTILGNDIHEPGLLHLCVQELMSPTFDEKMPEVLNRSVWLSCLEIKNEEVLDLLAEPGEGNSPSKRLPREAVQKIPGQEIETIHVKGRRLIYRRVLIQSFDEAIHLLRGAIASREVGRSWLNSESSRSHMVIRFTVRSQDQSLGAVIGGLTLVDLAGSEREFSEDGSPSRREETKAINVSLTHLNRMLVKMQNGELDESDRRQSALNMILYEYLREDCGVTMIFCIHPEYRFAAQARSTLQMAARCRRIVQRKRIRRLDETCKVPVATCEKEEGLQHMMDLVLDLQQRYDDKSRDYEVLRVTLDKEVLRSAEESRELRKKVSELQLQNGKLVEQVASLQQQLAQQKQALAVPQGAEDLPPSPLEKVKPCELAASLKAEGRHTLAWAAPWPAGSGKAVPDSSPRKAAEAEGKLSRLQDWQPSSSKGLQPEELEGTCKEQLEEAYRGELRALRAAYDLQRQHLQEAVPTKHEPLPLPAPMEEKILLEVPLRFTSTAVSDVGEEEPCCEPSVPSCRTVLAEEEGNHLPTEADLPTDLTLPEGFLATLHEVDHSPSKAERRGAEKPKLELDVPVTPTGKSPSRKDTVAKVASPQRRGANSPTSALSPPLSFHLSGPRPEEETPPLPASLLKSNEPRSGTPRRQQIQPQLQQYLEKLQQLQLGKADRAVVLTKTMEPPSETSTGTVGGTQRMDQALAHLLSAGPCSLRDGASLENTLSQVARAALQGKLDSSQGLQCAAAALRVMHMLPRSLPAQRDGAILLAELANKDAALKEEIVNRNALPLMVAATRWMASICGQASWMISPRCLPQQQQTLCEACSACCRALAVICQQNSSRQAIIRELGGLDAVLSCLSSSMLRRGTLNGLDALLHGCWLLMLLCHKNPANQESVRLKGGCALLLGILTAQISTLEAGLVQGIHRNSPDLPNSNDLASLGAVDERCSSLCAYVAGCLAAVVEGSVEGQQALFIAGGVAALLRALDLCLQCPAVVSNACLALANLVLQHELSQKEARAQGAVSIVLGALLAYRGHTAAQSNVCRAIAALTDQNIPNQQAFLAARVPDGLLQTGAVALLLQALQMTHQRQDSELVTAACWALSNLLVESPEAMDYAGMLAGPEIAMMLLSGPLCLEERACDYVCRFLSELIRGDSAAAQRNRRELQHLGAFGALRAVIEIHEQPQTFVLSSAREALRHLQEF